MKTCQLPHTQQPIRLLQLTDTHLSASADTALLGMKTAASFAAVIDEIKSQQIDFDAIISTGDISQDHSPQSYQCFIDGIKQWQIPCYWLPGNHDDQPVMDELLNCDSLIRCSHVLIGESWQLLMLDSQVAGVPLGRLADEQLQLIETVLQQETERHTLILMHHHPLAINSQWLDAHQLENHQAFWAIVAKYANVRAVICGHVHQAHDIDYQGCRVLTAPSTCIQFLPNSAHFALDKQAPGWREIYLYPDGEIQTCVKRITKQQFQPDLNSKGY